MILKDTPLRGKKKLKDTPLRGKKVLITGGTGGIGSAIVEHLIHAFDMNIFIATSPSSEECAREMMHCYPNNISGFICVDMMESSNIENIMKEACASFQKKSGTIQAPEILINCAGIAEDKLFLQVSDSLWNKHMQINLHSTWQITKSALIHMMKAKWGRVISISSIIGKIGNVGQVAYATSKAAIEGMTRSLSVEVADRNITVNSIMPGFIDTKMTTHLQHDERMKSICSRIPMGRMGTPQNVATAVEYLIKADYVTGTSLEVSGGMCRF